MSLKTAMIAAVLTATIPRTVWGADDSDRLREVRRWLDGEIERAKERPAITGFAVRFDQLYHAEVTRAELEALKLEVVGKPDHPAHQKMAAHERRLSVGPDRRAWTVWFLSPERWRINKTAQYPTGIPFTDHGRDRNDSWVLLDDSLVVIDAGKPPVSRDYAAEERIARMHLEAIFYAGFGRGRGETALSDLVVNGEKWTIRSTTTIPPASTFVLELAGRWDTDAGRGFVESRRITASPFTETVGTRWEYARWRREPALDAWVSTRVDEIAPDGRVIESLEWQGVEPVSQKEVEAMIAVPDPLAADVLRGSLKVRQVSDYRENARVFKAIDADGTIQTRTLERESPQRNIQWVGWALASLIIAALVYVRVRRGPQAG